MINSSPPGHDVVSPRVQHQQGDISVFGTDLWNTHWFRRYKREAGQRNIDNTYSAPPIRSIQNHWKILEPILPLLSTMAFSSDDSTCAPTSISTANEFSWLLHDKDALFSIKQKFAKRPTHAAIMRNYQFITMTMASLEQELEQQRTEHEELYEYLFEQRNFHIQVWPIVKQYRHKLAMICWGFHPYHCPTTPSNESSSASSIHSSTSASSGKSRASPRPITPSLVDQGPTSLIPTTAIPVPFKEVQEPIEDMAPNDDRLPSYDTAIDEPLGSSCWPIKVFSDDEQTCHGCQGNHKQKTLSLQQGSKRLLTYPQHTPLQTFRHPS